MQGVYAQAAYPLDAATGSSWIYHGHDVEMPESKVDMHADGSDTLTASKLYWLDSEFAVSRDLQRTECRRLCFVYSSIRT